MLRCLVLFFNPRNIYFHPDGEPFDAIVFLKFITNWQLFQQIYEKRLHSLLVRKTFFSLSFCLLTYIMEIILVPNPHMEIKWVNLH